MLHSTAMNRAQPNALAHPRRLIASATALLLAIVGIALMLVLAPRSTVDTDEDFAEERPMPSIRPVYAPMPSSPAEARGKASRRAKCADCGVIGAIRQIHKPSGPESVGSGVADSISRTVNRAAAETHEVTVRMQDGSSRKFIESSPAHWREGERVVLIEGLTP